MALCPKFEFDSDGNIYTMEIGMCYECRVEG